MDVTLAALADAANISQEGKLNILGEFNQINVANVPAVHSSMTLILRLEAGPVEYGQQKHIDIKFVDADGTSLFDLQANEVEVPDAGPGKRARLVTVLNLQNTRLPSYGDYAFVVLVNGDPKATVPLEVCAVEGDSE